MSSKKPLITNRISGAIFSEPKSGSNEKLMSYTKNKFITDEDIFGKVLDYSDVDQSCPEYIG